MKRYLIASISILVILIASFAMQTGSRGPKTVINDQQGPDSLYQATVRLAEQYLFEKKYDRCLVELEKAEKLKPQEQSIKDRITKVKGLIAEQQKKLPEYQKYVSSGDTYFNQGDYLNAKASYQMAIDIIPEDQTAREKLKKTMDLLRSQKAQNTIYDVAVASADKLFQQKEYERARVEYENASRILPSEKYPKDRINEIIKIQLDLQMKEEGYTRAISNADKLFNSLKYQQALPEYQAAQKIKPSESYPKERIARLHVILDSIKQLDDSFAKAIANGDMLFMEEKFLESRKSYVTASEIKPDQVYPRNKITEIDGILAANKKLEEEFQRYITSADSFYIEKQYVRARDYYYQASRLKPSDPYPKEMLNKTASGMTAQEAASRSLDEKYLNLLTDADKQMASANLSVARQTYSEASAIKPAENYPKSRIAEIDRLLLLEQDKKKSEEKYVLLIAEADQRLSQKLYDQAKASYQEALIMRPEDPYPTGRIREIDQALKLVAETQALDEKYSGLIKMADQQFNSKSLTVARQTYSEALALKPEEKYPSGRINEVDSILARMEQQKIADEEYTALMADGESFFSAKEFEKARTSFLAALQIKPSDPKATARLKAVDEAVKLLADMLAMNERYASLIAAGDRFFESKSYDSARSQYSLASGLKSSEVYPKSRISEIDQILEGLARYRALEDRYAGLLANADQLFNERSYEKARPIYQEALTLKPGEAYPTGKIAEIDQALKLLADQKSLEDKYLGLIRTADQQFSAKSYTASKQTYKDAVTLKPDEKYAAGRIVSIDSILASLEQQKLADQEYNRLMAEGDASFSAQSYEKAKSSFLSALQIKPDDQAATGKLQATETALKALADVQALNERYASLISSGDRFFESKSYDSARSQYSLASGLKSSEAYPKSRISEIDQILEGLARSRAMEDRYAGLLANADQLFNERSYTKARPIYQEALTLKPGEAYPTGKIAEIDQALKLLADQKALEDKYLGLIMTADQQFSAKSYTASKQSYKDAITLKPDERYPAIRIVSIDSILASLEQQKLAEQEYSRLMAEGDASFAAQLYEKAKGSFLGALQIKPNDQTATVRLQSTDAALKALADKKALEEQYARLIRQGDQFFKDNAYDSARVIYTSAVGVKPGETYPAQKIAEIDKIMQELARKKALDDKYAALISSADQWMAGKDYDKARVAYQDALVMKPAEAYPAGKIKEIEAELKLLADRKALDERYLQMLKSADQQFSAGMYGESKKGYQDAQGLKPTEKYPSERIAMVDSIIEEIERRKMMEQQFAEEMGKGETFFTDRNYKKAKVSFEAALKVKPGEQRAVSRLAETEAKILEIEEKRALDERYTRLITEGDQKLKLLQYDTARVIFQEASAIKPSEEYPRAKVKEIELELARLEQQRELDERYQVMIKDADKQFAERLFEQAKLSYIQALKLKPGSAYPEGKIKETEEQLALIAREKSLEDQFNKVILQSDAQFSQQQYDLAAQGYRKALELKAGNAYANDKLAEIESILAEQRAREEAYKAAVAKADGLFDSKSYEEARMEYENALIIKPKEQYPRQRIAAANNLLAELKGKQQTYDKLMANADDYLSQKDYQRAKDSYEQALALFPSEPLPQQRIQRINTINDSIFRANKGLYDKAIAEGDRFYNGYEFDKAIDSYNSAALLLPMENYPRDMIRKIQRTIAENAVADVLKTPRQITSGNEEKFSFEPVNMASRKNNLIYMKVKNLSGKPFNILMRYGTDNQANGGVIVRNLSVDGRVNERLISVKEQDAWYRNDNNWISLSPQGGDIEVSFIQVSRSKLE